MIIKKYINGKLMTDQQPQQQQNVNFNILTKQDDKKQNSHNLSQQSSYSIPTTYHFQTTKNNGCGCGKR